MKCRKWTSARWTATTDDLDDWKWKKQNKQTNKKGGGQLSTTTTDAKVEGDKKKNKKEPKEDGENCTKVSGGDLNESIVEYPNQSRTHNSWNETVIVVCMFVFK